MQKIKLNNCSRLIKRACLQKYALLKSNWKQHYILNVNRRLTTNSKELTSFHISKIIDILDGNPLNIIMNDDVSFSKYATDWTNSFKGGGLICFAHNTRHVSELLKYCNNHKIGVVPQSGNTGLGDI